MITPAQEHIKVCVLSRQGMFPNTTLGVPVIQGAGVTGIQGIGVSTPWAAVVAAATAGLVGVVHMPKGMMFTIGIWSLILAAGWLLVRVLLIGKTTSVLGANPMEHFRVAPLQT